MNDVWPSPEQQLFKCLVEICKAIQNKIIMLHYFTILLQTGKKSPIFLTGKLFYCTFLLYITFLLRKSTHTHKFLHLFGNILEQFQGPWKGSQARLLMSK